MSRFGSTESTPKRLLPIYGYLAHELLPLLEAIKLVSSEANQFDRFCQIAIKECHSSSEHGLTPDESAAIYLYTMEWGENSFYAVLNRTLLAEDRSLLSPWFAYLKLFDTAMQKLPSTRKSLWRGVTGDISAKFDEGVEFTWWTISSCSTTVDVIKDFLGSNCTLFLIEAINGKDISAYTNFPKECEVILCPGARFRVISVPVNQTNMRFVHLQEISGSSHSGPTGSFPPAPMLPSTMGSTSSNLQYLSSVVQIHIDHEGNRYKGEMKDGKKYGEGTMNYADGDSYTGIWFDHQRTGQGVYTSPDGFHYQ